MILQGFDTQALLSSLLESVIAIDSAKKCSDLQKARIAEIVASTDYTMISGGDEELNLLNALSQVAAVLHQVR